MGTVGSTYRPSQQEAQYGLEEYLIKSANDFAFSLYKELAIFESNFVCSPFCVNILLSMLRSGAGGDTALELINILGYSDVPVHEMQESFHEKVRVMTKSTDGISLKMANSLWIQEGLRTKQSFKDIVAQKFLAHQREVDFRNRSSEVTSEINEWGKVSSQGAIERLLSQDVDPTSIMILLNAVYFNGRWEKAFQPDITDAAFFNNGSQDNPSMVRFMHQKRIFRYHKDDKLNAQILMMDYAGECMTIVFFLPKNAAQLKEMENALNQERFDHAVFCCRDTTVDVTLPLFNMGSNLNLVPNIQNLGIHSIFKPNAALSGIAEGAMVNSVIHRVVLRVTEEGNIPVAVGTPEPRRLAAIRAPRAEQFKADRPFGFLIVDNRTNIIIFVGRVVTLPSTPPV